MEKDKTGEGMGSELLELVLKEILNEQQKANDLAADQAALLSQITVRLKVLEENTGNTIVPPFIINTMAIEKIIQKGMLDMQLIVNNHPKNVVRKVQVLLFPEHDTALYCNSFWQVGILAGGDALHNRPVQMGNPLER